MLGAKCMIVTIMYVIIADIGHTPHVDNIESARGEKIDGERRRAVCECASPRAERTAATVAPLGNGWAGAINEETRW